MRRLLRTNEARHSRCQLEVFGVYQTCLLDIALAGAQGARVGLLHASFFISAAASSPSRIGDGQPNFLRSGSEGLRGDLPGQNFGLRYLFAEIPELWLDVLAARQP